jgi:hypothetical protein
MCGHDAGRIAWICVQGEHFFHRLQAWNLSKRTEHLILFKRPSLLLRSLLSMSIIMPACAVALATAFELKTDVK